MNQNLPRLSSVLAQAMSRTAVMGEFEIAFEFREDAELLVAWWRVWNKMPSPAEGTLAEILGQIEPELYVGYIYDFDGETVVASRHRVRWISEVWFDASDAYIASRLPIVIIDKLRRK